MGGLAVLTAPSTAERRVARGRMGRIAVTVILFFSGLGLLAWAGLEELHEQQDELHAFVLAEENEEELERANACEAQHARYEQFLVLAEDLTHAGATVGTDAHLGLLNATPEEVARAHRLIEELLPAEVQPIIDRYPPPDCDRQAALDRIEEG